MKSHFRAGRLSIALFASVAAFGCAATGSNRPTEVAQGKSFRSGNADYDRFFDATHALQVKVGAASDELADARQHLTDALKVARSTGSPALAEGIKNELDRLNRHGTHVRVDFVVPQPIEPSGTRAVLNASSKPRGEDANLLRQLESSVTRLLRLEAQMRVARRELDVLCSSAFRLESNLEASFSDRSQRALVTENLRDAERAITLMLGRAEDVQAPTADLLSRLAVAVGSPWRPAPLRPELESTEPRYARSQRAGDKTGGEPGRTEPASSGSAATGSASSSEPVTRADFEP
ncbi:MAG TPA: hypothetical protein VFQ35_28715 [Polyangiaceae bacterium]|nr:hypothetical protein [Polyangiaceae bacterium]